MLTQLSTHRGATRSQDLVDLLVECHQKIRHFVALAREVALRGQAPSDQVVQACADVERYFVEALPLHVADEEDSVEPRLRGLSHAVDRALDTMARQHQQHQGQLEALLRASAQVRNEPNDAGARSDLAAAAIALDHDIEAHLVLEERAIFPAIRQLLGQETQSCIIEELRQRRRHDRGTWPTPPTEEKR